MKRLLCILFNLYSLAIAAQGLGTEEITIRKERDVELKKANRVFEKISLEEKSEKKRTMTYDFFEKKPQGVQDVSIKPNVVAPVDNKNKKDQLQTSYNNYVKLGAGNYGRLFGEAYINSPQTQKLIFGIYGLHNSASRGPIQGANSGINLDQVRVDGKYHGNNFELKSEAGFERRSYHFFGYDTLNYDLTKSELRQRLNILNFGVSFENTNPKPVVDYMLKSNIRTLNDFYEAEEIDWGSQFDAHFPIIKDRITAMLNGEAYLTQRSDSYFENPVRKRNLFRVEPAFNINFNAFNAKVGFKAVNQYDQIAEVNETRGFPTATLTYKTRKLFYFFVGYDGDIIRNTLYSMLNENPWLKPQVELKNTVKEQEIYVGSRGDLLSGLSYDFKAAYGNFGDLYFFNTHEGDPKTRQFDIFYESHKTDFVNITAEVNFQAKEFWRTNLKADYWYYETVDFTKPYHRPAFQGLLGNTFVAANKIVSTIDLYYIGSTFAKDPFLLQDVKIPEIIDLNAEFTYLFSQQFSVFVKLNNIIGKNYQRYLNYPQMGLNFVAGINVSL